MNKKEKKGKCVFDGIFSCTALKEKQCLKNKPCRFRQTAEEYKQGIDKSLDLFERNTGWNRENNYKYVRYRAELNKNV